MHPLKILSYVLLLAGMLSLSGCGTVNKIIGKSSNKEQKAATQIQNVEAQIGTNLHNQLAELASLHYGVDYALSKEGTPSKYVDVARDLNARALSLSGMPSVDEVSRMRQLIDDLTSQLATERVRGAEALQEKDKQYAALQIEKQQLEQTKDAQIQQYMNIAKETAMKADASQAQLDKMNSYWGLGAVGYGLKRFFTRLAWAIGIGLVLFLILRFAAATNPMANSIFSVFETIGSWAIHAIRVAVPGALKAAGQVPIIEHNKYKDLLIKIVDSIETLEQTQKRQGTTTQEFTLNQIEDEFSKAMDTDEKQLITSIKQNLGYTG